MKRHLAIFVELGVLSSGLDNFSKSSLSLRFNERSSEENNFGKSLKKS